MVIWILDDWLILILVNRDCPQMDCNEKLIDRAVNLVGEIPDSQESVSINSQESCRNNKDSKVEEAC